MKSQIQNLANLLGYEIHQKGQKPETFRRSTMHQALAWLSEKCLPVKTILDVGASDGRWSRECMKFFPSVTYVLCEPQPTHRAPLDVFASEHPGRVIPVKKAIGPTGGQLLYDVSDPWVPGTQQRTVLKSCWSSRSRSILASAILDSAVHFC